MPYFADLFGKDGTINRDSFTRLPENLRTLADGELKNITTADQLFQKLHGLSGVAGRKALAPLPADAKPEDIAAQQQIIRAVLGVPEKADGYAFTKPEDLPEGAWNQAHATAAQELLHKHNASPALAKDLLALQTAMVKGELEANAKYESDWYKGQDDAFRTALQKDNSDYDRTMAVINGVATKYGIPLEDPILKNAQVRMLLKGVAAATGEAPFVGGQPGAGGTKSDQALAEDIVHNKQNPDYAIYWDPNHAKHGEVKKRVEGMFEAAARAQQAAAGARR